MRSRKNLLSNLLISVKKLHDIPIHVINELENDKKILKKRIEREQRKYSKFQNPEPVIIEHDNKVHNIVYYDEEEFEESTIEYND